MHDDRLDVAERILKPHLKEDPFDVRAIRMLAELAARIGRLKDAETLLRRAVEHRAGVHPGAANLAMVLGRLGRPAEALAHPRRHIRGSARRPWRFNLKAATLARLGNFEQAIALYEQVLKERPNQPRVLLSYGHMMKTVGRLEESVAAYRKAIDLEPTLGEAWWSLANLKTVRFNEADVQRWRGALAGAGSEGRRSLPPRIRAGQGASRRRADRRRV